MADAKMAYLVEARDMAWLRVVDAAGALCVVNAHPSLKADLERERVGSWDAFGVAKAELAAYRKGE